MQEVLDQRVFKKGDAVIVLVSLMAALAVYIAFSFSGEAGYVEVTVESKQVFKCSLSDDRTETLHTQYGDITFWVKNGETGVAESDCSDKICVKSGKISKTGQSIVCLPLKTIIKIKGREDVIYAY